MDYTVISKCRVCGGADLKHILDLGVHPLANSLKRSPEKNENKYPLNLVFCPRCSLLQIKETVKKEILFDQYIWMSGTSALTRNYAHTFYENVLKLIKIKPSDLILEIASNDGTFLKPFLEGGHRVVGIEPAKNIAAIAQKEGITTINNYWGHEASKGIVSIYGKAKIVIARNVIPHASELHDVMRGIAYCLDDEGVGVIEFHYAGDILKGLQYDSIYHEHLCYFSIASISYLLKKFNLPIFDINVSPISGGAYCVYFSRKRKKESAMYKKLKNKEEKASVNRLSSWEKFAKRCISHRDKSRGIVDSLRGKKLVGFGASARSSTYLNFCGFASNGIKAIIDNNRLKQGFYSAGSSIPIVSMEEGFGIKPDLLFVLAWNFKEEIMAECQKRGYGGRYLIPFPVSPYFLTAKNRRIR